MIPRGTRFVVSQVLGIGRSYAATFDLPTFTQLRLSGWIARSGMQRTLTEGIAMATVGSVMSATYVFVTAEVGIGIGSAIDAAIVCNGG
jgi:hypothetical protein